MAKIKKILASAAVLAMATLPFVTPSTASAAPNYGRDWGNSWNKSRGHDYNRSWGNDHNKGWGKSYNHYNKGGWGNSYNKGWGNYSFGYGGYGGYGNWGYNW